MIGAMLIGTTGILVRYADVAPTVSAFWRMALGAILLCIGLYGFGRLREMPKAVWLWCLAPGAAFAADLFLWHKSIHLVGPGMATLLANAQVFFMALIGFALFSERIGKRLLMAVALAFSGLWLMLGQAWANLDAGYQLGVWLGIGTAVCYSIYNVSMRKTQAVAYPVSGEQVLMVASFFCAFMLGVVALLEGHALHQISLNSFLVLLLLGFVGQCLGWVLIVRAMPALPIALIGLLLLLQPTVAFVLDVVLFDRQTTGREWFGLALALCGIFFAGLRRRQEKPAIVSESTGPDKA